MLHCTDPSLPRSPRHPGLNLTCLFLPHLQSFPNADGMEAQLKSHLYSLNRQADLSENKTDSNERDAPIDLIVVTDSEAILGKFLSEQVPNSTFTADLLEIRPYRHRRPGCRRNHCQLARSFQVPTR